MNVKRVAIAPARNISGAGMYAVVITSAPLPSGRGIFFVLFIRLPIKHSIKNTIPSIPFKRLTLAVK